MSTGRGKRRARITIQAPPTGQDAMGAPNQAFTDYVTIWARVKSVSGTEAFAGQQYNPEQTHMIEIDVSTQTKTITPLYRIIYGSKILDILNINSPERDLDPIYIVCKERVLSTGAAQ